LELAIAVAVVALAGLLAIAVLRLRRTPTIGQGELPGQDVPHGVDHVAAPPASLAPVSPGLSATERLNRFLNRHLGPTDRVTFDDGRTYQRVDDIADPALRDQIRSGLHGGSKTIFTESFVVGDRTYHSLDEIPDAKIRDELRKAIARAESNTTDPALKAAFQHELDEATKAPEPSASESAPASGAESALPSSREPPPPV
jgi:hypothetical protein